MSSETLQIAFIGAGNMARSLIFGLLDDGFEPVAIRAADPVPDARATLSERGVTVTADNAAAIDGADAVVLAVKPQVLAAVLRQLPVLAPGQLLISVAAGAPIAALEAALGQPQPIVRCMPNTPALVGAGAAALYANALVSLEQRTLAQRLLESGSQVTWVATEADLDAVIAVSGSGPAYFFAMLEAMIETGVELGLEPEQARLLAGQTALGAATMALQPGADPGELRRAVTSPNGTTQAALEVLTRADFAATVKAAMQAAVDRAQTLAEEFSDS